MVGRRAKGSIEWVSLTEILNEGVPDDARDTTYEGVEVALRHIGPRQALRWRTRLMALKQGELRRIMHLRKEFTADLWPELHEELGDLPVITPEATEEMASFGTEVLGQALAGIRGAGELDSKPVEEQVEELDRLGLSFVLVGACMAAQAVRPEQFPSCARPRGVPRGVT